MNYPKVLIIGESFHMESGGGITLSNLFEDWPPDKLALIGSHRTLKKTDTSKYKNFYQIGEKETFLLFPFCLFQKKYSSGTIITNQKFADSKLINLSAKRDVLIDIYLLFTHFFGIYHAINRYRISKELLEFSINFKPDYIYSQLSTRELIFFVNQLIIKTKVPSAIHIMDDWPKTINAFGILKKYWDKKIDSEFKKLLSYVELKLAISDSMRTEYESRYGGNWLTFHNPISTSKWVPFQKYDYKVEQKLKILYVGRIGTANSQTIKHFSKSLITFMYETDVEFSIFSPNYNEEIGLKLKKNKNTLVKPPINHEEIPNLVSKYDLLYLPLDFNKTTNKFSKLSMPTKMSEYMISGVPILIHSPSNTAIFKYAKHKNFAYLLDSLKSERIHEALIEIIENEETRKKHGRKSKEIAIKDFESKLVKEKFLKIFL